MFVWEKHLVERFSEVDLYWRRAEMESLPLSLAISALKSISVIDASVELIA